MSAPPVQTGRRLTPAWAQSQHDACLRNLKALARGLAQAETEGAKRNPIGAVEALRRLSFIESTALVTRLGLLLGYYEERLAEVRIPELPSATTAQGGTR